jgi:hypothetical protein
VSNERTHNKILPEASLAVNDSRRPSGEILVDVISAPLPEEKEAFSGGPNCMLFRGLFTSLSTIHWGELHIIESLLLTPLEKHDIAIERCYA